MTLSTPDGTAEALRMLVDAVAKEHKHRDLKPDVHINDEARISYNNHSAVLRGRVDFTLDIAKTVLRRRRN